MEVGKILDTAYVVVNEDGNYYTANRGLFVTKRNAEKCRDLLNKWRSGTHKVVKINLVIAEE